MKRFKCIFHNNLALERFNCSNPSLEFDNVKHIQNRPNPEDPVLNSGAFPSRNFELNDQWMKKRALDQKIDTKNRIFGKTDTDLKINVNRA